MIIKNLGSFNVVKFLILFLKLINCFAVASSVAQLPLANSILESISKLLESR